MSVSSATIAPSQSSHDLQNDLAETRRSRMHVPTNNPFAQLLSSLQSLQNSLQDALTEPIGWISCHTCQTHVPLNPFALPTGWLSCPECSIVVYRSVESPSTRPFSVASINSYENQSYVSKYGESSTSSLPSHTQSQKRAESAEDDVGSKGKGTNYSHAEASYPYRRKSLLATSSMTVLYSESGDEDGESGLGTRCQTLNASRTPSPRKRTIHEQTVINVHNKRVDSQENVTLVAAHSRTSSRSDTLSSHDLAQLRGCTSFTQRHQDPDVAGSEDLQYCQNQIAKEAPRYGVMKHINKVHDTPGVYLGFPAGVPPSEYSGTTLPSPIKEENESRSFQDSGLGVIDPVREAPLDTRSEPHHMDLSPEIPSLMNEHKEESTALPSQNYKTTHSAPPMVIPAIPVLATAASGQRENFAIPNRSTQAHGQRPASTANFQKKGKKMGMKWLTSTLKKIVTQATMKANRNVDSQQRTVVVVAPGTSGTPDPKKPMSQQIGALFRQFKVKRKPENVITQRSVALAINLSEDGTVPPERQSQPQPQLAPPSPPAPLSAPLAPSAQPSPGLATKTSPPREETNNESPTKNAGIGEERPKKNTTEEEGYAGGGSASSSNPGDTEELAADDLIPLPSSPAPDSSLSPSDSSTAIVNPQAESEGTNTTPENATELAQPSEEVSAVITRLQQAVQPRIQERGLVLLTFVV